MEYVSGFISIHDKIVVQKIFDIVLKAALIFQYEGTKSRLTPLHGKSISFECL